VTSRSVSIKQTRRSGFSLVEMMIAIVILGLGLTMVATMFPVAWDRARLLSEYTTEVTVTEVAATAVESMLRPGGMRDAGAWDAATRTCAPSDGVSRIGSAGLAGDLIFDPTIYYDPNVSGVQLWQAILNVDDQTLPTQASDTRVHALHLENLLADARNAPPETVGEDPWKIEQIDDTFVTDATGYPDADYPRQLACGFVESSFFSPRFPVNMRVYPPLDALPNLGRTNGPRLRDLWSRRMEGRRFAWGVLHRLREYVGPSPDDFNDMVAIGSISPQELAATAAAGWGSPRVFDMYYVTLRRPNATNRYAIQDPGKAPDPYNLSTTPAQIQALPLEMDVQFPVAWRVQIELPPSDTLNTKLDRGGPREPNGIPTNVLVPPEGTPEEMVDMWISMFPRGTQFVDEINGRVYRVMSTELSKDGLQSILTLDQEITLDDIDLKDLSNDGIPVGPPECPGCQPLTLSNMVADPQELLRTVWVYPPPVDRSDPQTVVFKGRTPVSAIEVRTATLTPASR
jgi:prepilin-type N-terminal cleavage/methylation domain-containing protein